MSGPKDYSPPPKYSIQAFDGKLNEVFKLQSRLKMLCSEIEGLHVSDSRLNIHFDCKTDFNKIRKQIDRVLKALIFDYKGTFGQDTYDRINGEIDLKISELLKAQNECDLVKTAFTDKKADYNSFLSYLIFYDNSNISFDEFRSRVIQYLKTEIESDSPGIFKEAEKKISFVEFNLDKAKFGPGFNSKLDSEKQAVIDHVIHKEDSVNNIRAEISDKVIDKFRATGSKIQPSSKPGNKFYDESNAISEKIKFLTSNCNDAAMRKKYKAELEKLTESESLKDIYFFKELHDSILETEKTRKAKVEINSILSELNTSSFHLLSQTERQNLTRLCLSLLNGSCISKNEYDDVQTKLEQLKNQSDKFFEDDAIKNKERIFLKSQLILCLENRGYEVMDDLEVIDFEKESDFLLKIRGQENYLNLKFKEDGSMRYVFQIPEDKEKLTTDDKNLKLHEMKVTCQEFQSVLRDLTGMGLKMNLRSEKPIDFNSIISVSGSHKEKIKIKTRTPQQKQQLRKKYLN
jgi:hypothetical protein